MNRDHSSHPATPLASRVVVAVGLAALLLGITAPVAWNAWRDASRQHGEPSDPVAVTGERAAANDVAAYRTALASARIASSGTVIAADEPAPAALLQIPALASVIDDLIGDALGQRSMRDDPHAFRARLGERVRQRFAPAVADAAMKFVLRYVGYLESLDAMHLRPPANDLTALRATYEARRSLRLGLFSPEEYAALFAADDRLDRYTMARLDLDANPLRTSADRATALAAAERELTASEREERARWQQPLSLQSQTSAFDARNASDAERFAARAAEHGEAVAQRLAALDQAERDWAYRLGQYELALNEHRSGTLGSEALAATRNRLFNERELLRLDAALSLRR